jgi:protein-S-isoprenylcysteine O-methyltransferase Ste14
LQPIVSQDGIAEFVYFVVIACLLGFGAIAIIGKRGAARGNAKRDLRSTLGFLLQIAAYAICFTFSRTYFSSFLAMSKPREEILSTFTILLAVASTWFCYASARTLGKQWALMARVIVGHELIAEGPYAAVRNPIYLAMFGMLIASGLASSQWPALLAAIVVFLAGTWIRIHAEETLLRENFGAKFDSYAQRVPAFLPRLIR